MKGLGLYVTKRPRTAAALAFGAATLTVQHFAWFPSARMSGAVPALTIMVGMVHAVAGAITGPRLLDGTRTNSPWQAGLLGAGTSLLALAMFAPLFTVFLFTTDVRPVGAVSYFGFPFLIAAFAFLGGGWALLLTSMGIGWALYRVAA